MVAMDMGMSGHGPHSPPPPAATPMCKVSMLWNWHTIDACFIARSWHIKSTAMFAGSCIGVLLFVMLLEAVRRAQREYDAYIIRSQTSGSQSSQTNLSRNSSENGKEATTSYAPGTVGGYTMALKRRPTLLQQAVRAALYMVQFGMAYFVMLLAMYYNGYLIICILIGAFLGNFVFGYDNLVIT